MSFCALGLTVSLCLAQSVPDRFDAWEARFGPADVTALSGNGGLTIGVNRYGRVTSCRWPSPGYHDQLSYRTVSAAEPGLGVKPWHGAMWAVRLDGTLYWLTGPPWETYQTYLSDRSTTIETVYRLPGADVEIRQVLFVHPAHDLLVARLMVRGAARAPQVYWFQNFTPCTRLIPEAPIADWFLDALNDFAVFAVPAGHGGRAAPTIYHFRPAPLNQDDWIRAERLAATEALPSAWSVFDKPGRSGDATVWIGATSPDPVRGFQCGRDDSDESVLLDVAGGKLTGAGAAVGQCHSVFELDPVSDGVSYSSTVFVAFGANRRETDAQLDYALERSYLRLLFEAGVYWRGWLEEAGLTLEDNALESLRRRALLTIAQATDNGTGVVVRAPITQPPLAVASARHGAWVTWALDMAGLHNFAERNTRFYQDVLRTDSRRGMPRGSLPAASYANGVEASPHLVVDLDASAWMLAGFWRHATYLSAAPRREYLASVWESTQTAAGFLAGWSQPGQGPPLYSFQPELLRDGESAASMLAVYMGFRSAVLIAESLGRPVDREWTERLNELDTSILFQLLRGPVRWDLDPTFPFWLRDFVAADHRLWREASIGLGGEAVPMGLAAFPAGAILGAGTSGVPDAGRAALQFIGATLRLYSPEPHPQDSAAAGETPSLTGISFAP